MRIRTISIVASCILSLLTCALPAQEESPDQAKMEALWKAFSTPGEHHARFQEMVGNWTVKTTDYTMNASAPAITSGDATFETIMGGRYLLQHFRSTVNGEAFEGMGITGYDNSKKKYVGSWIDNMGTGVMTSEGTLDPATHTMTEYSEMSSPMGPMRVKMVSTHESDNQFTFTMYMLTPDGKETKSMELIYTRAAK